MFSFFTRCTATSPVAGSTSVDKVGKVLQDLPVDRDDVVCSFPLLAGHPHRGAAVRFRRMRLARGLLSKMASGMGLKRRWRKHAGSPEVYSLRSTPCLLPSAKRGAQPPRQRCGHLSQNGYSLPPSLSLSLCAWLTIKQIQEIQKFSDFQHPPS